MTGDFLPFAFTSGAFLIGTAAMAAWSFRSSSAHLAIKLIVPASVVAVACLAPLQIGRMMGFPTPRHMVDLPQRAELLAFVADDEKGTVDLWLREDGGQPRAYETALDDTTKKTLKEAQQRLQRGIRVGLEKGGRGKVKRSQSYIDIDGGDAPYQLDPDAFHLPKKDQQ